MRNYKIVYVLIGLAGLVVALGEACRKPDPWELDESDEWYSGGRQTVFDEGSGAYGHPFTNMSGNHAEWHEVGDANFEATFVTAPAPRNSGLGPVFNSVSCVNCHVGDGRGKPPEANEQLLSLLFRMSVAGTDPHGGPNPVPGFGGQLQQRAILGEQPEGDLVISYNESPGMFADGNTYSLRVPSYVLQNTYMALPNGVMLSPRVAPPVFGLGLLEAIPEHAILAHADPNDADGDGISGVPNYVWNPVTQTTDLGRFGWKAGSPSLLQQTAGAYSEDMGVTNFVFARESCDGQIQHDGLNDEYEISDSLLHRVSFYIRTLAVPARRNLTDPRVQQGKKLFSQAQCATCHVPYYQTGVDIALPEISSQRIFPYTDLLLHDMGLGLSDNRPDFLASGQEWRTPPLWGIGLTGVVNGHQYFLHDGRARSLEEAILWHGGEAQFSRDQYVNFSAADRLALIAFLQSL
jgi:CxxC motif-containing protein (DUF1111 family)